MDLKDYFQEESGVSFCVSSVRPLLPTQHSCSYPLTHSSHTPHTLHTHSSHTPHTLLTTSSSLIKAAELVSKDSKELLSARDTVGVH